jgi:hypothetical protein
MARKTTDIVQVKLRVPEWLRREVLQAADKSGRSLNGELVHLIQEGLEKPKYAALIKGAIEKASVAAAQQTLEVSRGGQLPTLSGREEEGDKRPATSADVVNDPGN